MARGEAFPIINCSDLGASRRFYESVLGTGPAMYGEIPLPVRGTSARA